MKTLVLKHILSASLLIVITGLFIGCGDKSSTSSRRSSVRPLQSYCDPNYSANCNYQTMNGVNNNCGANNVMTDYGCRPRGGCPANYGFDQQTNQCFPAVQYNTNYQQGYNDPYYQGGYNNGYNSGYNTGYNGYNDYNYNSGYNQNSYYNDQNYYDPYQSYYGGY